MVGDALGWALAAGVGDGSGDPLVGVGAGVEAIDCGCRALPAFCTYNTYMPNKTISVPDDVVPIIESLGVPFSRWVTDQLRRHAAGAGALSFAQQLLADAVLAGSERPTHKDATAAGERMELSAPW